MRFPVLRKGTLGREPLPPGQHHRKSQLLPTSLCIQSVMPTATATASRPPKLVFRETFRLAYDTFCTNKVRFALTSLGMVIGTASLILVVTIGMTGRQYVV